jgi:PBP1b-binding outer membrane lipoprotein LpoB
MVKFKNIMLITVIGIAVLLSGCTGNKNIAETAQPAPVQTNAVQSSAVQTPVVPYQVMVTEVKTLQDCIVSAETTPCILVNLQVKNNNVKSLDFKIVSEKMVSISGKQLGMRYDTDVGLSNLCVRQAGMEFKLDASTDKNVGICYPMIQKGDNPTLILRTYINGESKEYRFDLTKYGLMN